MEDENKKSLDYSAEFQYDEDYFSDYTHINIEPESNDNEVQYDDDFMQGIQDNIDDLVTLIPGLPIQLQTVVNQVFKPILLDWRENFKDKKYPSRIPDPDKGIIRPIVPDPNPDPNPPPGPTPPNPNPKPKPGPGEDPDPNPPDDTEPDPDPKPNPPDDGEDPKPNPPDDDRDPDPNPPDDGKDPNPPNDEEDPLPPGNDDPPIKLPVDPWYPGILPPGPIPPIGSDFFPGDIIYPGIIPLIPGMDPKDYPVTNNPEDDNEDDLFTPATSKKFVYEDVDPIEVIKLEFDKNVLDLYNDYTQRLRKIIGDYYTQLLELAGTKLNSNDMEFMLNKITLDQANVMGDLRHIMDSALRSEVMSNLKVDFSLSMFSLENGLYHMKNVKVVYELRLRYAESKKSKNTDKTDSLMNRILDALRMTYDAKYDNAYINWYKYLNSSLEVLADILRSFLTCLRSKATIIKKGGTKE